MWFTVHLKGPEIPDPSGQLAELIVYITSTRVDLYCHQIIFGELNLNRQYQTLTRKTDFGLINWFINENVINSFPSKIRVFVADQLNFQLINRVFSFDLLVFQVII